MNEINETEGLTEPEAEYLERFRLVFTRIEEIPGEAAVPEPFRDYFSKTAGLILSVKDFLERKNQERENPAFWRMFHDRFFSDLAGDAYEISYANPAYALSVFGEGQEDYARMLSFLLMEVRGMIPYAYEDRIEEVTVLAELFVEIYDIFEDEIPGCEELRNRIYWYAFDYLSLFLDRRIEEQIDPKRNFAVSLIRETGERIERGQPDETDLYRFGEYIAEEDLMFFRFTNSLPAEAVERIAETFTEGYRMGFVHARKDLSAKKTVCIRYQIGAERIISAAIRRFEAMGLTPVIYRAGVGIHTGSGTAKIGYFGSSPNQQCAFDHRQDQALFLDKRYISRRLEVMRKAYEDREETARGMAGPAVLELFGEAPFTPVSKDCCCKLSERQQKLTVELGSEASQIVNTYIPGEERSFTIMSLPTPQIGPDFPDIFRDTVRINTLDAALYEQIQQKLIDVLDTGTAVEITGRNGNRTRMHVALQALSNPVKETLFENCLADVNIPVGEVFTTPELDGTSGMLHVKGVFLNSLYFKDLELTFADGMITSYSCANFDDPEENRRYIRDSILHDHPSLPLGEFAIGTNTLAAVMKEKYGIEDRMTILIEEKTGPHFAVGDTCYSHEEDNKVFNPDGKEILPRDNRCSLLRRTDESKAYFQCHTDITIPYEELGDITVIRADGTRVCLLRDGRFILPGTEILNKPFDEEEMGR